MENKDILSSFVQKIIKDVMQTEHNKKFRQDIIENTKDRIVQNKVNTILNSLPDDIAILYDTDIYWLAKFLTENASKYGYYGYNSSEFDKVIDVNQYFTNDEKNSAEMFTVVKENMKKSFKLEGVRQLADDMWICDQFTYAKIKEGMDNGFLTYNFNTQREAQVSNIGIDIVKTPTVYVENIKEIKELMINKSYEPNMVTVNILVTGEEEFSYNKDKGIFEFFTTANIADGYHRDEAARDAVNEKPSLANDFLILKITHYDVFKAQQRIILQESKGSKISDVKQKSLEPTKSVQVAKRINEYGSKDINVMFDKISDNVDEVFKVENKYCLINAISDVIDETYGNYLDKPSDISKITKYLVEFFNEIAGQFEDDFYGNNIKLSRETSVVLHNNMFSLFTYLAKVLYNKSNWQNVLAQFISQHDFSMANALWKDELKIKVARNTGKHRKAIYNWVDNQLNNIVTDEEIAVSR